MTCLSCKNLKEENRRLEQRLIKLRKFAGLMAGAVIENTMDELDKLDEQGVPKADPCYHDLWSILNHLSAAMQVRRDQDRVPEGRTMVVTEGMFFCTGCGWARPIGGRGEHLCAECLRLAATPLTPSSD